MDTTILSPIGPIRKSNHVPFGTSGMTDSSDKTCLRQPIDPNGYSNNPACTTISHIPEL